MFGIGKKKQLEAKLAEQAAQIEQLQKDVGGALAFSSDYSEFFNCVGAAGKIVSPESAKRVSVVYACVRLIACAISSLPLNVYERTKYGREHVEHDLWWLLNEQPHPTMTASSFWEWMVASILLRGDGIAEIQRTPNGAVRGLLPHPRERVEVVRHGDRLIYLINGEQRRYGLEQEDVLHFPGFGFNGLRGESVIQHAAHQAIGTALAADDYAAGYFERGAAPSVAIEFPQGVAPKQEQVDMLREQFEERYGGVKNSHKPLVLANGGKLAPVSLTAEDSQLLETRKFQVIDIARAFGVPPHMIGETTASTSWGSGVEQMSIAFVRYTINPFLTGLRQEVNRKVWPRSARYFVEHDLQSLLAGDSKAEAEYLSRALGGPGQQGWMSLNEVRRRKYLPPEEGGNKVIRAGAAVEKQ